MEKKNLSIKTSSLLKDIHKKQPVQRTGMLSFSAEWLKCINQILNMTLNMNIAVPSEENQAFNFTIQQPLKR